MADYYALLILDVKLIKPRHLIASTLLKVTRQTILNGYTKMSIGPNQTCGSQTLLQCVKKLLSMRQKRCSDCPEIVWHVPPHLGDGIILEDENGGGVQVVPNLNLVPQRATQGSMAYDFVSPFEVVVPGASMELVSLDEDGMLAPEITVGKAIIDTLVAVTLPPGYAMILGSRSGLAAKHRLTVEAGWIDNDYRGKIGVVVYNHGPNDYIIQQGERIAQGMIVPVIEPGTVSVEYSYPNANETARGAGGFGSTGKR